MTIKFKTGNIFDTEYFAIVNPVNCVGVMGKGMAKTCRELYSENFKQYRKKCFTKECHAGDIINSTIEKNKMIINLATKYHWKNKSEIKKIIDGINNLRYFLITNEIESVAIPALGCGCGELKWETVKPSIIKNLSDLQIKIEIYEPLQN